MKKATIKTLDCDYGTRQSAAAVEVAEDIGNGVARTETYIIKFNTLFDKMDDELKEAVKNVLGVEVS